MALAFLLACVGACIGTVVKARGVLCVIALTLVAGCTQEKTPAGSVPETDGRAAKTKLVQDFEFEGYPGSQWYGPQGEEVPMKSEIINLITAPEHCDWQSATMMHVGRPLGDPAKNSAESDQYIRDPERVLPQEPLMSKLDLDARLPDEAEFTGYRTNFMELWLNPNDDTGAYLVFADHVERWPKTRNAIACA